MKDITQVCLNWHLCHTCLIVILVVVVAAAAVSREKIHLLSYTHQGLRSVLVIEPHNWNFPCGIKKKKKRERKKVLLN